LAEHVALVVHVIDDDELPDFRPRNFRREETHVRDRGDLPGNFFQRRERQRCEFLSRHDASNGR
jgi:hypothetical protein